MKKLKNWFAWAACAGLLCPSVLLGETTRDSSVGPRINVHDVSLSANNVLAGRVVNAQGQALNNVSVRISSGDNVLTATTDGNGNFQTTGLKGGLYQVSCQQSRGLYRLWVTNTAPPAASQGLLLVQPESPIFRGQCADGGCSTGGGAGYGPGGQPVVGGQGGYFVPGANAGQGLLGMLANPWVIGAAVAVAIAVPLALDDDGS